MSESELRHAFPKGGASWPDLKAEMAEYSADDADWRHGRVPMFVFKNDAETQDIGRNAFFEYFTENGLGGTRAFHGVGRMEREVLDYGLALFEAPDTGVGVFSPGGSESIFIAVKAARDAYRARAGAAQLGLNIVMPVSAHAAFDKAAQTMDLEIRRAPLRPDMRVDIAALGALVDDCTMLIVGSAPCYPHGVVDPLEQLSDMAVDRDVWLHVDACVGGWILPFYRRNGREVGPFDFTLPGVRSLSADLHKFGFCPKPASTVFFRDRADQERAQFVADAWPSGVFRTATLAGTRPAGAVAAAWAVLNHLGSVGYARAADRLATMTDAYVADIQAIDGMQMWAKPDMSLINFGSHIHDMTKVAAQMTQRGWLTTLTRRPVGIHIMMSLLHEEPRQQYVADLRAAVHASASDTPVPNMASTGYAS
ncbi:aminotransferase class V-fold PLP-dependent enzyme [Aestuariivita sp.]|uniref:pyridoxal phosphate-dependent decarboxylase family protein n=1 Tax=Aestuariivita sp. TaxID=1872407 RepID=UPI00216EF28F|nr:aminotransferase class V-fold PLP-dependent enzyme [Aestuariivita sp.]MCE8007160.1 aspartate aminotransferase family protein [Aestuariivita sp.]